MSFTLAVLAQGLRTVLFSLGIVLAGVAALDWAVRTRRLNPFGGVARFMRARVDPRLGGVERLVARTGGHQSNVPWWALVAYFVLCLLLLAFLDLLRGMVADAAVALSTGAAGLLWLIVDWAFGFLIVALMVRVLSSWLPALAHSRWTAWSFRATEWMLGPLRRVIPAFGPVDITPIVAYFGLTIVRRLVETVLMPGIR
ncbi:MAG: hypothetical protein JWL60_881 [Gemmatimonadetes bacterium]|jgi:YggT family protein|nr:hypothetical protein [Gemmatimonadota bacterium]